MDTLMGSTCYFSSPIHHSLLFSEPYLPSSTRNAHKHKRVIPTMACLNQNNFNGTEFSKRRAIIFMGFAAFPLLRLNAQASQPELADSVLQASASPNLFVSLLNGLGIIGAGVLGALYALAVKERDALDANLESIRSELMEKDVDIQMMRKKFETELLSEKLIQSKQVKERNDEKQSLIDQLTMTNDTIANQGKELQTERKLADDLKSQIDTLQLNLERADEDRSKLEGKLKEKHDYVDVLHGKIKLLSSEIIHKEDNLEALSTPISVKERAFSDLSFSYQQSEDQKKVSESAVNNLKDQVHEYKMDLEIKNTTIHSLNAQLTSLLAAKEALNKKVFVIQNQYNNLKNSSAEKEASDVTLLEEQRQKVNQLEKQLERAQNEDIIDKVLIYDLTQERNDLKTMLDIELKKVKCREQELQMTEDSLRKSMDEASVLAKQLQQSKYLCSELQGALSKVKVEFSEEKESLERSISEAKHNAESLAYELKFAKDLVEQKVEKLKNKSQEILTVAELRDRLEQELTGAMKKAETATQALKEEKENSTSLRNELKNLETEMSKDKEARKLLEANLSEATRSLDGSNHNVLTLSKDIEIANSRISNLEDEIDVLHRNLVEQKQISQQARENLEDAHNLVMRLGKERETLEIKGVKLEEELAAGKDEILRLRSQMDFSRSPVNNQHQRNHDSDTEYVVPAKKASRRRRVSPSNENS